MTTTFAVRVVARAGSADPGAPLVVLFHGRGGDERDIIGLAEHLPQNAAYAAVRAPIAEGDGFAWFANRGIGRPLPESLAQTMAAFRSWLDAEAPAGRPVVLVGFSGGAAFAGGLLLADSQRYAAAAILYGTLPFEAGVPVEPARLFGTPVFIGQGADDMVIPRDLLDRTWDYVNNDSGASAWSTREPGGHQITVSMRRELAGWMAARLDFVARRGQTVVSDEHPDWPTLPEGTLPARRGPRPAVSTLTPQQQQTQNAPSALQERVFEFASSLPGVTGAPSRISVPGARGFTIEPPSGATPDAYVVHAVGEFAHLHPASDGSMHLALPVDLAADVIRQGWAVAHPLAGIRVSPGLVMVYGPRDEDELTTVTGILAASHVYATGSESPPTRHTG